jgi:PAS domain S-box-containing protein
MVAERKRIEQMLRHLGMVTEKMEVGIIVIDLKGIVHFVNTAWAKMHGYATSNELLGKSIDQFHTREQMKTAVTASIHKTRREGEFIGMIDDVRQDGTAFCTRTKMVLLKDEKNNAGGVMAFVTDMTENKLLKEGLEHSAAEVEQLKEQIVQLQEERARREGTESELQEHCERLEQRVEQLSGEQRTADKHAEHKVGEGEQAEKVAAQAGGAEESRELEPLFDPEKLKALAEMAKQLRRTQ